MQAGASQDAPRNLARYGFLRVLRVLRGLRVWNLCKSACGRKESKTPRPQGPPSFRRETRIALTDTNSFGRERPHRTNTRFLPQNKRDDYAGAMASRSPSS